MANVTIDRVAQANDGIMRALAETSDSSTLSDRRQAIVLADACAQACELLRDWVSSDWWEKARPAGNALVKDTVPREEDFREFLEGLLDDALTGGSRHGIAVSRDIVSDAIRSLKATVRRFPRLRSQELFDVAREKTRRLQKEMCSIAERVRGDASHTLRRRARAVLAKVVGFLPTLVLGLAAVTPQTAVQNLEVWGHDVVQVMALHQLAATAEPGVRVAPPDAGPQIR
jgi:hypothetical protein